jgi:hypothetical protein
LFFSLDDGPLTILVKVEEMLLRLLTLLSVLCLVLLVVVVVLLSLSSGGGVSSTEFRRGIMDRMVFVLLWLWLWFRFGGEALRCRAMAAKADGRASGGLEVNWSSISSDWVEANEDMESIDSPELVDRTEF